MKIAALIVLTGCACANAQVWNEVGDAGQNGVAAAQMTSGVGPLMTINGSLSGTSDVDLYCIHITNEALFLASVSAFAGQDTQLFLFNMDGTLQVWNDDYSTLAALLTSQGVFSNGDYILGISSFAERPVDAGNSAIYAFGQWAGPDTDQRMGTGGILAGWNTFGDESGNYEITLRGVEYCIPTPGAAAVLGLGALASLRRRR